MSDAEERMTCMKKNDRESKLRHDLIRNAGARRQRALTNSLKCRLGTLNQRKGKFALLIIMALWAIATSASFAQSSGRASKEPFYGLPLSQRARPLHQKVVSRYGVPFLAGNLPLKAGESASVPVCAVAKRIFLLGMTESAFIGCWADPTNYSVRAFIGDHVGEIVLNYSDGTTQTFPLILGENIWWGQPFYRAPGPFPESARFRKTLASALFLYPPAPVRDGQYVAVIVPRPVPLQSITISSSPAKRGIPAIVGITIQPAGADAIPGARALTPGRISPQFAKFAETKSLRPAGEDEKEEQRRLNDLRLSLYSSDETFFKSHIQSEFPASYDGPKVFFDGNIFAKVLANVFVFNVQDIADKVDPDGMYHTSTKGALLWGYNGGQFGSYATNVGCYYNGSWTRDMGRSLQELTELGYTNDALRCANYCLRMARLWERPPAPKIDGHFYPPHWSRVANAPQNAPPYENDGQGLVNVFLYKLWQRLPDRNDWLRTHWPDIKDAGDWILWQFDHPEISGSTNGVLHTTGECAGGNGYSVYADAVCMKSLRALAEMADSIGETNVAEQWRDRADKMQAAITRQYIIDDPKYGRVWTLAHAGWPTHPTVLGPLIFTADYNGFAPQDDSPVWRPASEAAYQRLIDTYGPFGFYGDAMGYGQGFVTESALLLDRMRDATTMLNWVAKEVYDPRYGSFVVPEGVQIDPTGRFWYRAGDLGNGVQEAEIVKTLRLVIGVDDTHPDRLQFYPRMPYGWTTMSVSKYPVLWGSAGNMQTTLLQYQLKRAGRGMKLQISAGHALGPVAMRLGPFAKAPDASDIVVNGQRQTGATVEHSGDSWWVSFTAPVPPGGRLADEKARK